MLFNIVEQVTSVLKSIEKESYFETNTKRRIDYPYLTFELTSEQLENSEGMYLDIDIWDNKGIQERLLRLESELKLVLHKKNIMTDDLYMRMFFIRSNSVVTKGDNINRRNLQFYLKIYRRND